MKEPIELQAEILTLIARAEALGIRDLSFDHKVITELKAVYIEWLNVGQSDGSEHTSNAQVIKRINQSNIGNTFLFTLTELKQHFETSRHNDCLLKSIKLMTQHLEDWSSSDFEEFVKNAQATNKEFKAPNNGQLLYKNDVFKKFVRTIDTLITEKKHFYKLKDLSKKLGYNSIEYYALLNNCFTDESSRDFLSTIKEFQTFTSTNYTLRCISIGLSIIPAGIGLFACRNMLINRFIIDGVLTIDGRVFQAYTISSTAYMLYKSAHTGVKNDPYDLLPILELTFFNSFATGALVYYVNDSKNLQCAVGVAGLAAVAFDLCSTKLLEYIATPQGEHELRV